jgi:hypothetical protein
MPDVLHFLNMILIIPLRSDGFAMALFVSGFRNCIAQPKNVPDAFGQLQGGEKATLADLPIVVSQSADGKAP